MSGEGPESIPTSADPRSKRPLKRRALTPVSAQAASVDALFAKPDQEIRIPPSGASSGRPALPPPPEIVTNVQGSSAGAGSGEFHVYKAARRREYERLRRMDEDARKEEQAADFEAAKKAREAADAERTRKNREKREKLKARKAKAKNGAKAGPKDGGGATGGADANLKEGNAMDGEEEGEKQSNGHNNSSATASTTPAVAAGPGIIIHDDD